MSTALNQSFTLQPNSEGKNKYLVQKAFCIKTGRAKQLQEEMWPQDGTGCSSLEGNSTQAAPNSQRSAKDGARQEKPSLTPARAVWPQKHLLPLHQTSGRAEGWLGSWGSRMGRELQGGCAGEAGAKRVSPGVSSACTRQPLRGSPALTYSFRAREFPVALARGIQIDIFTLTSLLTGVFTLRETG